MLIWISQVSEVLSIALAIVTWLLINNISNMQKAQLEVTWKKQKLQKIQIYNPQNSSIHFACCSATKVEQLSL